MFIVTNTLYIKIDCENEVLQALKQYYPSPNTLGFINIEVSYTKRVRDTTEFFIRTLWKTQEDYREWLTYQKESTTITWQQQIQPYIISSKSNAVQLH
ncbi:MULTISPECIES: antibiotic biosynthesis monooxygenase [unclassified Bacillus (in: firmicutes)]|uniref:antibiotic biosynthesis monooxygenase family protein n=1 Tax=unclassified Bacillus (in: firmicutes) TaxID=185979 RepID=UPI0008ED21E5|nr:MULTISPECIES: antibiotic biosynthesis monooxygenase [unclassified Bacillus (in: firmicutes)]SFJ88894.1 Antibiotic biosynthesis monooxygenase [Bacillus sp. 71mf]SFT07087.1 Antibiotic biosynthesis monooxygenase [Bacillus sp. 103mf]